MEIKNIYDDADFYDAEDLLKEINKGHSVYIENDHKICMINGGRTELARDEKGYYLFSFGQNWRDQEKTYITEEKLKERLEEALENVIADFETYEHDTQDTKACYITINQKEEEA